MGTPRVPPDIPNALAANREDLRRRARAERVRSVWLWVGILAGPLAFLMVRIASIVLVSHGCRQAARAHVLGLTTPQVVTAGITLVGALITIAAGLISWRIWRQTSLPEDEVSVESMPRVPFWALGGILVSVFCLGAIALNGGLALVLTTGCP